MAIGADVVRRLTVVATDRGLTSLKTNLRETDRAYDQVAASATRAATATEAADRRMMALLRQRDRYVASLNAGGMVGAGRTAAGDAGMFAASRLLPLAAAAGAAVAAFTALNKVWERGVELLDKYGNAQRNLVKNVDESLASLTRFQDAGLSADQVKRATELGARLFEAKRTIDDFLNVQLNVTNAALKLQAVWVAIVEVIAAATTQLGSFMNRLPQIPGGFDNLLKVASGIPVVGIPATVLRAAAPAAPSTVSAEDAMTAALERLKAGMGSTSNFANRFGHAVNDLQNPLKETKKAVEETVTAFDAYDNALQRTRDQNAVLEEQVKSLGKTTEEVDRLRIARELERAAAKAGRDLSPELQAEINAEASRYAALREEIRQVNEQRRMVESLGSAIVSAFTGGGNAVEKLTSSLAGLGTQLASKNLSNFLNGGSVFGKQPLGSAAGAAGMLGAGAMGYQSGSALTGALGGAMAGATFGPWGMAAGAAIGGIGGLMGDKANKAKADAEKYQAAIQSVLDANAKLQEEQQRAAEEAVRVAEAAAAKVEAANRRAESYTDRAFFASNDNSTEAGILREFDRKAQREREAAIRDGNQDIALLDMTLYVERLAIQKQYVADAIDQERQAAEERTRIAEQERAARNQAQRGIADFLLDMRRGAESPLSSSQRLSAAQGAYGSILGVAQNPAAAGNLDALNRITQDAQAFYEAALAYSPQRAQQVFDQIQQELGALSTQDTTDPIVAALNNIAVRQESTVLHSTTANTKKIVDLNVAMLKALNEITRLTAIEADNASSTQQGTPGSVTTPKTFHYDLWKADWDQHALFLQSSGASPAIYPFPQQSAAKYNFMRGGMIPGYANGGMVGNGMWNVDSVLARFAGGGSIGLAGGEGIITAPRVRELGGRAWVDSVNRGGGANDNRELRAELAATRQLLARALSDLVQSSERGNAGIERNTIVTVQSADKIKQSSELSSRMATKAAKAA